jgi:hypothetical protein
MSNGTVYGDPHLWFDSSLYSHETPVLHDMVKSLLLSGDVASSPRTAAVYAPDGTDELCEIQWAADPLLSGRLFCTLIAS